MRALSAPTREVRSNVGRRAHVAGALSVPPDGLGVEHERLGVLALHLEDAALERPFRAFPAADVLEVGALAHEAGYAGDR